jgi:hypothetical protein
MEGKAENLKRHALRRIRERRGVRLSDAEYARLCNLLKEHAPCQCSRDVKFLIQASLRLTHWAVYYLREWMVVIYDAFRNRIVTVLCSDALRYGRYQAALKARRLRVRRHRNGFTLVSVKHVLKPS